MIVCLCVIQFLVFRFDLILLDMLSDPAQVKSAILSMSVQQLRIHIGITATLDVALPLAYGCFFVGVAYRFFPGRAGFLSLPAVFCVPVDLFEGIVQLLVMLNAVDWTSLKAVLTPLKLLLIGISTLITVAGLMRGLVHKLRGIPQD